MSRPNAVSAPPGRGVRTRSGQLLTTRVGLVIPPALGFEEWAEAGPKISRIVDSFAWCLGDWLVFGQDKYEYRYATVLSQVSLDYKTLRNYAWVARKVPMERRRDKLSFQHHAEVASLPPAEQDAWLDRVEDGGWTRSQLRKELALARQLSGRAAAAPELIPLPRVEVDKARIHQWRAAAERQDAEFAEWMLATLDDAAASILHEQPAMSESGPY